MGFCAGGEICHAASEIRSKLLEVLSVQNPKATKGLAIVTLVSFGGANLKSKLLSTKQTPETLPVNLKEPLRDLRLSGSQ